MDSTTSAAAETPGTTDAERAQKLLDDTLMQRSFGALAGTPPRFISENTGGVIAALAFIVPIVWTAVERIGLLVALVAVAVILYAAARNSNTESPAFGLTLVAVWFAAAGWQQNADGWQAVLESHVFPLVALGLVTVFRLDLPALLRSAPLLFPLVLIVLVVPLLTAETWQAAAELTAGRVLALGVLLILPVLFVLTRQLASSLTRVYAEVASEMTAYDLETLLFDHVKDVSGHEDAVWLTGPDSPLDLESLAEDRLVVRAAQVMATVRTTLRRKLTRRLLPTAIFVGALVSLYLYLIAAALIDPSVAASWSDQEVGMWTVPLVELDLPGGPYIDVAMLLGFVATGVFLALVITDDNYATALTDALLHEPARVSLALGGPYLDLMERQLETDVRG